MDAVKCAVARLECGKQGTAFLVNEDTALTATHCVTAAAEENREILLTFYNIPGNGTLPVRATLLPGAMNAPAAVLKLKQPVKTQYPVLACYTDQIARGESLFSYGYPGVEGIEGYPLDIKISQYLNENMPFDYDISVRMDAAERVEDFTGMSGSPVLYRNQVIGLLTDETLERSENRSHAVALKVISNHRIRELLEKHQIPYREQSYQETVQSIAGAQIPREYRPVANSFDNGQKNYREESITGTAYGRIAADYEDAVKRELNRIFTEKSQGRCEAAWRDLIALTGEVRSSRSRPKKLLADLYYTRAVWYLDDKRDGHNAQRYLQKVLECDPKYDRRIYDAKKSLLAGNVINEKEILYPIDQKEVLNTYLQICICRRETEDALDTYREAGRYADHTTYYLMAVVSLLDREYDLAEEYLNRAEETVKDAPLYLMMRGVIRYWRLLPDDLAGADSLLPPLYFHAVILADDGMRREVGAITELYQKALALAEQADNRELQIQILTVWMDTLSFSDVYREDGNRIAKKLLGLEAYQCQAVIYLCMSGEDLSEIRIEEVKRRVREAENPVEPMMSCVYLALGRGEKRQAYALLKEFRYKFEEQDMMEYWFTLAARACSDGTEVSDLEKELKDCGLDPAVNGRISGILLESAQDYEALFRHAKQLYAQTGAQIDLVNLIYSAEKVKRWREAEGCCREWEVKFGSALAKIHVIRCLAMQGLQTECLNAIETLCGAGRTECLTDEVLYLEAQALKILCRYEEAIEKSAKLWEKVPNQQALLLLSECYFLNGEDQSAISILKEGVRKGNRSVKVYQTLAELEKRADTREAVRYVQKACMVSEDDPQVMLWGMNFLFQIGQSEKANELLVKLQALGETDYLRQMTFKEVKELIDEAERAAGKKYELYRDCAIPYHVFFDDRGNDSYTRYCCELWEYNRHHEIRKAIRFADCGNHQTDEKGWKDFDRDEIVVDFSALVTFWHLDLFREIRQCFKEIYLSGNINLLIAYEQACCMPHQPDVTAENKRVMESWEKRVRYLERPTEKEAEEWEIGGVHRGDTVRYRISEREGLFWITDHLLTDLMDQSGNVPADMRRAAVTTDELLEALERRGEISRDLKEGIRTGSERNLREEIVEMLMRHEGRLPVLVDLGFLQNVLKKNGTAPVSQACEICVSDNVFEDIREKIRREEAGETAIRFLEELKSEIADGKEEGYIRFFGHYSEEEGDKREDEIGNHTGILRDLMHFAQNNHKNMICDDRWVNSFGHFEETRIGCTMDVVEFMHLKGILSDEKYTDVITRMMSDGYGYFVPPTAYMRLLLFRTRGRGDRFGEISAELKTVCRYLTNCTASPGGLSDKVIHEGMLPESAAFVRQMQQNCMKLLGEIWDSGRPDAWKYGSSNWLLVNYSVFAYRSAVNRGSEYNMDFYALEYAEFIFCGFFDIAAGERRKSYYNWLYGWIGPRLEAEEGLEERMIHWLADVIANVNKHAPASYYEIGVGAVVSAAMEDMPVHYADKMRENGVIRSIAEAFEGRYTVLGTRDRDMIRRETFSRWIEDSMRAGTGQNIKRKNGEKEFELTWLMDDVLTQGFRIRCGSGTEEETLYIRLEGAKLFCADGQLRAKGFYALETYIPDQNRKGYRAKMQRPEEWEAMAEQMMSEAKLSESYLLHKAVYMLEHDEYTVYTVDELIPEDPEYFADKVSGAPEDLPELLYLKWADREDEIFLELYTELVMLFTGVMRQKRNYRTIDPDQCVVWIFYQADQILEQMEDCLRNGSSKYASKEILAYLSRINAVRKNRELFERQFALTAGQEAEGTEELIRRFSEAGDGVPYHDMLKLCRGLGHADREGASDLTAQIRRWIGRQWRLDRKESEEELLLMMQYVTAGKDRETSVENYLSLWNEILEEDRRICISAEGLNQLKSLMMILGFKQGRKVMELTERICFGSHGPA